MKECFVCSRTVLVLVIVIVSVHRPHHPNALELLGAADSLQPRAAASANVTESESGMYERRVRLH